MGNIWKGLVICRDEAQSQWNALWPRNQIHQPNSPKKQRTDQAGFSYSFLVSPQLVCPAGDGENEQRQRQRQEHVFVQDSK